MSSFQIHCPVTQDHNNLVLELVVMGDPTNLKEKLNFFMQWFDTRLNNLARKFLN